MDATAWASATAASGRAGEIRVNLVRLAAVGVFYSQHLARYLLGGADNPRLHVWATVIAMAWAASGAAVHLLLSHRRNPPSLKYATLTADTLFVTLLVVAAGGPAHPLAILYVLLIPAAGVRHSLTAVWIATLEVAAAYGATAWWATRAGAALPELTILLWLLTFGVLGVLTGQTVREARRLARAAGESRGA